MPKEDKPRCDWYEDDLGVWKTSCGNRFEMLTGTPNTNKMSFCPYCGGVLVEHQRNGDKRADLRGRVPDDVLDFSRVCGTFKERREWSVTQHPEALIERLVKMTCKPGDLVVDMFAHSGTTNRVCKRLGIDCIGVDISQFYCQKIAEETGAELVIHGSAPKTLFKE